MPVPASPPYCRHAASFSMSAVGRRVLRPGGLLYLGVKEGVGERWTTDSHGHALPRFFAYYQGAELDDRLRQAGFRVRDRWSSDGQAERWLNRLAVAGA